MRLTLYRELIQADKLPLSLLAKNQTKVMHGGGEINLLNVSSYQTCFWNDEVLITLT